jgi:hypothetical protein
MSGSDRIFDGDLPGTGLALGLPAFAVDLPFSRNILRFRMTGNIFVDVRGT